MIVSDKRLFSVNFKRCFCRNSFLLFLFCMFFFHPSYLQAAQKSTSRKNAKKRSLRSLSEPPKTDYSWEEKSQIESLKEIHSLQLYQLRNKGKLTNEQSLKAFRKFHDLFPKITMILSQIKDFPYRSHLDDMNEILTAIRHDMIPSKFSAKNKTDEQLLLEIQDVQLKMFLKAIDESRRKNLNQSPY